jgi:hypothetical protein
VKLSISVSAEDVAVLDAYARTSGLRSRSAVVQHAIHLLRHADLEGDYAAAWDEWDSSGHRADWEGTVADGLSDASR